MCATGDAEELDAAPHPTGLTDADLIARGARRTGPDSPRRALTTGGWGA